MGCSAATVKRFSFRFMFFFLQSLTFQKITRVLTAVDSQPMFDGGVLINVLGRLQVSMHVIFVAICYNGWKFGSRIRFTRLHKSMRLKFKKNNVHIKAMTLLECSLNGRKQILLERYWAYWRPSAAMLTISDEDI